VWTQVSMIQLGTSIYGERSMDEKPEPPPRAEIPFRLEIKPSGRVVVLGRQQFAMPKVDGKYNLPALVEKLKEIKEIYKEKVDCVINMTDELEYVNLIDGMDALLISGFPQISIATGGAE